MSTAELVKLAKSLSERDRDRLLTLLAADNGRESSAARKSRRIRWPDVEARARRIFGRCFLPNLVLLERQQESS